MDSVESFDKRTEEFRVWEQLGSLVKLVSYVPLNLDIEISCGISCTEQGPLKAYRQYAPSSPEICGG